jgi:hypothetical protein
MLAPVITAEYNGDSDCWELLATSHGVTNPAGPRLFRGGKLPAVAWLHVDEDSARADAAALQRYVDLAWQGKAPKGKGREEKDEVKLTKFDFANAVWM